MKEINLSNLILPLAAAFALFVPLATQLPSSEVAQVVTAPAPHREPKATAASKPTGKPTGPPFQAAALICEFVTPEQKQCPSFWRGATQSFAKPESIEALEFLLATLPDPQESSFNYVFDRYLEAIQRALEVTGYTIDRYDLPWLKTGAESKDATATPANSRSAREPGVILFRKNEAGKTSLLVLFLISETPTTGIYQAALLNALEQTKRLSQSASTIRLLGPTFSGSATSLTRAVRSWLENNALWQVNIISGSATAIDKADFLRRSNPTQTSTKTPTGAKERVRFSATVTSSASDWMAFINGYLKYQVRSLDQLKIAMLRESNTTYGQSTSLERLEQRQSELSGSLEKLNKEPLAPHQDPQRREQKRQALKQELEKVRQERQELARTVKPLELPFPLHISKLRTAAEKANSDSSKKSAEPDFLQRKHIPLRMDESKESTDVVPMFSEIEIASRELVLSNLLSTINRERINYLGLVASNAQDRIFLVRQIRQHCPNVVIFTLGADILYLHPDARADFRGLLLVTPYPLFNPNQLWTYPFSGLTNRLQFPLPNAQGIYNATLALFDRPELMLEYGSPFDSSLPPDGVRKPSLWLSVVGRDRFWPIKTLEYSDSQQYLFRPQKAVNLPTYASVKDVLDGKSANLASQVIATLPGIASGAFSSKASLIGLLALSLICCVPSAVLFIELARTKLRSNINPLRGLRSLSENLDGRSRFVQWLARQTIIRQLGTPLVPARFAVLRWIARWRIFKAIDASPLARIFSDPVLADPELKFKRRCYLLVCCLILLGLAVTSALVYLMPIIATMKFAQELPGAPTGQHWEIIWYIGKGGMPQYFLGQGLALCILLLTLPACLWMLIGFLDWLGHLLNDKVAAPLKNKFDQARVEAQPLPLGVGWLIFVVVFLFKMRFAVSTGLLTATAVTYRDHLWQALVHPLSLIANRPAQEDIFFFLRTTDLLSGVSPLLPLLFVGVAAFLAFLSALRRLTLLERTCCGDYEIQKEVIPFLNFEGAAPPSFIGVRDLEIRVKDLLRCSFLRLDGSWLLMLALIAICYYLFFYRFSHTVEGRLFDVAFGVAFSVGAVVLSLAFLRFVWLWVALRRMLRRLSWHPLFADDSNASREFFQRLPKIQLTLPMPAYASLAFSLEQACRLVTRKQPRISDLVETADDALQTAHRAESKGDWRTSLLGRVRTQGLLAEASALIAQVLEPHWKTAIPAASIAAPTATLTASDDERWIRHGRLFLASRVTSFLHLGLAQLQNLAGLVTVGSLLLLLALSSYPFQPRELLMLFSWSSVLLIVAITLVIFVQMGRDKVLSLLSGTTPGQVSWNRDFIVRILIHGLLPILALLGAQFPHVIGQLISWLGALQGGHH
jgi:hypothetical protein